MELKTFLQGLQKPKREELAQRCSTSVKHLQNIAYGYKTAGEKLCIDLERESRGAVSCEELRPDVDWNFLRNTKKKAA